MNNETTVKIETITPTQAIGLCDSLYPGQRDQRPSHIAKLAADMRNGRFRLSPSYGETKQLCDSAKEFAEVAELALVTHCQDLNHD